MTEYNEVESTPAPGTSPEAPGGPAEDQDGTGPEEVTEEEYSD